jgi:hypothetical protein
MGGQLGCSDKQQQLKSTPEIGFLNLSKYVVQNKPVVKYSSVLLLLIEIHG